MGCTCCNVKKLAIVNIREKKILYSIIGLGGSVRFNQLRKETGYHQEILSRILKRLIQSGYIWRDEDGRYNVCCKIRKNKKIC